MAPGARVWSVRVLNSEGYGTYDSVACGLRWIYDHRATIDVVNMSIGFPTCFVSMSGDEGLDKQGAADYDRCRAGNAANETLIDQIVGAGIPVVVAAGNDGIAITWNVEPANNPNVIAVEAYADFDGQAGGAGLPVECGTGDYSTRTEQDDTTATFSDTGGAIAAPGVCVLSDWPTDRIAYATGTSMAAPFVTGAVALLREEHPDWQPWQIRIALRLSATESAGDAPLINVEQALGYQFPRPTEHLPVPPLG